MELQESLRTEKTPATLEADACTNIHLLLQGTESVAGWLSKDIAVLDYFAGDVERVPDNLWDHLEKLRANRGEELYSDLMMALTHRLFPTEEAHTVWDEILAHKYILSEMLKRNVGVRVAVLDFFDNHKIYALDLRLLPEKDLNCLLLFVNEDGLTGLYNHRFFQEQLRHELSRARRYNRVLSLLLLDLDHFKEYNDRLGHRQGDRLLQNMSELFMENKRESDTVARYGGDEFALILPETNHVEAVGYAKRLKQTVFEKRLGPKREGVLSNQITISIGVATFPGDGTTAEELIEASDQALYRAKKAGRNGVRGSRGEIKKS